MIVDSVDIIPVDRVDNVVHTDPGFFSLACCSKLAPEWLSVISEFAFF